MLAFEREHWLQYPSHSLAGVDEAGRGPLAGPVVAAAVVIPQTVLDSADLQSLSGLTDSKKLRAKQREHYYQILQQLDGVEIGVGWSSAHEIDEINILQATYVAMRLAIKSLPSGADFVLVDGLPVPKLPLPSRAIVHGDALSLLIAAASIVAKTERDAYMVKLDQRYPGYGFAKHKGYGTRLHMQALLELGPCPEHRHSFRPVREAAQMMLPLDEA